jgi:hypothetical protein
MRDGLLQSAWWARTIIELRMKTAIHEFNICLFLSSIGKAGWERVTENEVHDDNTRVKG